MASRTPDSELMKYWKQLNDMQKQLVLKFAKHFASTKKHMYNSDDFYKEPESEKKVKGLKSKSKTQATIKKMR
jgi:inorganic pyrophosphatase